MTTSSNEPDTLQICASSQLTFAAVSTAANCARLFVRDTLRRWHLDAMTDSAEQLAYELVEYSAHTTGAGKDAERWHELPKLNEILLRLLRLKSSLLIQVWDVDPTPPRLQEPEAAEEKLTGLRLIGHLSSRWNYFLPGAGGRVTWCELVFPQRRVPLPRREPASVTQLALPPPKPLAPETLDQSVQRLRRQIE